MQKKLTLAGAVLSLVFTAGVSRAQTGQQPPPASIAPKPHPTIPSTRPLDDATQDLERSRVPTPPGAPERRVSASTSRPSDSDGSSVDAIVAALYASVSHGEDGMPNFDRMRGIFLPVGMLIPPKDPRSELFTVLDVDGFEERVRKGIAAGKQKGDKTSFFESEAARKTDCFGNVCQVFSTYESRHAPSDEKPFVRGINSIQLVNDGRRWWVASVVWDTEKADRPIPPQYLSNAPAAIPQEYLKKN